MVTKEDIKSAIKSVLCSNGFQNIVESQDLVTPFFKDEFNLSAGHQFVLPTLHSKDIIQPQNKAITQWCIRKDDISRLGYTDVHLSSFEMFVFGRFGFIDNKLETQKCLLKILLGILHKFGINYSNLFFSITEGAKILDTYLGPDETSYNALREIGIDDDNIIWTKGRQNFVFSNGQDRASGYNIEIFYKRNAEYIEIASSNIYEYILDGNCLIKTKNSGIGVGIGIERLQMIVDRSLSICDLLAYDKNKYVNILGGEEQYQLAKSKVFRIEELSKTIDLIKRLVFDKGIEVNQKQLKSYRFIKAKLDSELDYLQIVRV